MLLCAPVLAGDAPQVAQERALSRYAFLWADSLLGWCRRWRNEVARSGDRDRERHAVRVKREVAAFAALLERADGVRDYLVAKRQPLAQSRAADIEATALLWLQIHPRAVNELWLGAAQLYDALAS